MKLKSSEIGRHGSLTYFGALILTFTLALLSGCNYTVNTRPDVRVLDTGLVPGHSTAADVRTLFGEPNGRGRIYMPVDSEPREVWSYYHERGSIESGTGGQIDVDMRRMFLFVYFLNGRYDGYMWFSSLADSLMQ
jgi:hypothetical protein